MSRGREFWQGLSAPQRAALVTVGAVDVTLRVWGLVDLARRPASQVKGPKAVWAVALGVVNSAGALPLAYLLAGRRRG